MVFSLLATLTLAQAPLKALPVQVTLRGREFVFRAGDKTNRAPLESAVYPKPASTPWPPERVLFRKDAGYAVWDARGLSVRQGSWVFTTQLSEIPLSPKLFSREEISQTKLLIEGGARKAEASGIVGALRDGPRAYFLAKWDEAGGKTWMEALVSVDLTEEKPKPKLVGRFEGQSLDFTSGKSRLFIRGSKPSVWVRSNEHWGLAQYDPEGAFVFEAIGDRPEAIEKVDERVGWFVGKTEYGSRILFRWDALTLNRRELIETRGTIRLMDERTPWIAVVHEDEGSFLQNVETGGRVRLPANPGFRRTAFGVLVWSPAAKPTEATLYETTRWDAIGKWASAIR